MYKHASRFNQQAPELNTPAHHEREREPVAWAVVAFREGRDNQRRPRVYRRVWTFQNKAQALRHLAGMCTTYPCAALLHKGAPVHDVSHELLDRWMAERKGVNADADPWRASQYARREIKGIETWEQEIK